MKQNSKAMAKFNGSSKERLLGINLKAIELFADNRAALVDIYFASKRIFGDSPELDQIVNACKEKQAKLDQKSE